MKTGREAQVDILSQESVCIWENRQQARQSFLDGLVKTTMTENKTAEGKMAAAEETCGDRVHDYFFSRK